MINYLNRFIQFRSDSSISLISSAISSIIRVDLNDILIQLPYYDANSKLPYVNDALKRALKNLKESNLHLIDQDQLDSSIMYLFNPILSKLSPIDFLYVLPYSLLRNVIVNDSDRIKKAFMTLESSQEAKFCAVLLMIRGNTIRIKGPYVSSFNIRRLLRNYQITLEIV